jgi:hypothetical protein
MQALWVVGEAAGLNLRVSLVEVEHTQTGWYCTPLHPCLTELVLRLTATVQ